jgi:outer membrane protein assembly factor BamB
MRKALTFAILAGSCFAADWPQYRGPNGSGVGDASRLPTEFGPAKNVVWKTPIPPGNSSPVLGGGLIFLTGTEGGSVSEVSPNKHVDRTGKLYTFAINPNNGKIVWRQEAPRNRLAQYQTNNSPATPTPVTDGENVYVFFQDFGLLAYTKDGAERWRLALGPFKNINGFGSSPILYKNLVILLCDQDAGSYLLAVDKNTGHVQYKIARPEATRGYSTPAVFQPEDGPAELIVPGAYQVTSYYVATGEKAWWISGFSWHPKTVPVIEGNTIYAMAADIGNDSETQKVVPTYADILAQFDVNRDGKLSVDELRANPKFATSAGDLDLDVNGFIDPRDWSFYTARMAARNILMAIRHGGHGDLTETNVLWNMKKFLPNCTSPLIYQGIMYVVKEGGILTALDPKTGKILKQGRLTGALDLYYASPVAGAGKIYLLSHEGKATVIKSGADWEILAVNDLEDNAIATPAIAADKLYVRTRAMLYCFADVN